MVLVNKTLEEMLNKIEFTNLGFYEIIIPEKNGIQEKEEPPIFTKELVGFCRPKPKLYHKLNEHIKKKTGCNSNWSINEIIGNAFTRGNKNVPYLPVSFKLFSGKKGIVLRVRDSGGGFDYKTKIKKMREEKKYSQGFGVGLDLFDMISSEVSYEGNGSIINVCILKE